MARRRQARYALLGGLGLVVLHTLFASVVLPRFWTQYDARSGGILRPMVTATLDGRPGDPIDVGLLASRGDIEAAMAAAGWYPADPVTVLSSLRIAASVPSDRAYPQAPVSPLLYEGQVEAPAFEKPIGSGTSASGRVCGSTTSKCRSGWAR